MSATPSRFVRLCLLLALLITGTSPTGGLHAAEIPEAPAPPALLLRSIAACYQAQLNDLTAPYFRNHPELDRVHTVKLKAYLAERYPLSAFSAEALAATDPAPYRRAGRKFFYRHGAAFAKVVSDDQLKWSQAIGENMGRARDIYVLKFIEQDPFKEQLYTSSTTAADAERVFFMQEEISLEHLRKHTGEFEDTREGDRFFFYCTPASYWQAMMGEDGFLQVRNFKIIKSVTRMSN